MTDRDTRLSAATGYADLVRELHQAAEEYDRGHGVLHAAAANAIQHLETLLQSRGAAQSPTHYARLLDAAKKCVESYPVASGRAIVEDRDGYGWLRELRLVVDELAAQPPVETKPDWCQGADAVCHHPACACVVDWEANLRKGTEFAETPLSRCSAGTEHADLERVVKYLIRNHSSPTVGQGDIHGGQTGYILYEPGLSFVVAGIRRHLSRMLAQPQEVVKP
jgi:hypothetical protein